MIAAEVRVRLGSQTAATTATRPQNDQDYRQGKQWRSARRHARLFTARYR
jgi:hypothetical protein